MCFIDWKGLGDIVKHNIFLFFIILFKIIINYRIENNVTFF